MNHSYPIKNLNTTPNLRADGRHNNITRQTRITSDKRIHKSRLFYKKYKSRNQYNRDKYYMNIRNKRNAFKHKGLNSEHL
jgi:hypothetical protein